MSREYLINRERFSLNLIKPGYFIEVHGEGNDAQEGFYRTGTVTWVKPDKFAYQSGDGYTRIISVKEVLNGNITFEISESLAVQKTPEVNKYVKTQYQFNEKHIPVGNGIKVTEQLQFGTSSSKGIIKRVDPDAITFKQADAIFMLPIEKVMDGTVTFEIFDVVKFEVDATPVKTVEIDWSKETLNIQMTDQFKGNKYNRVTIDGLPYAPAWPITLNDSSKMSASSTVKVSETVAYLTKEEDHQ